MALPARFLIWERHAFACLVADFRDYHFCAFTRQDFRDPFPESPPAPVTMITLPLSRFMGRKS